MNKQLRGSFLLLLTAAIWGAAFVAQSESMSYIGPFTMQAARFLLAGLVLLPVIVFCDKKGITVNRPETAAQKQAQWKAGLLCGTILFIASTFQQIGLIHTSVGKSGFITALYITIVPLLGVFLKKKVSLRLWFCALLALVGLYILCVRENLRINLGDWLTLICALFFSFHICYIDSVSHKVDCIRLSCTQFFVCSVLSAVGMLLTETPGWEAVRACWLPIVYAGVCSGGIAYTLQIIGQKTVQPTLASLIMSMESVFAALFGWLLIRQTLSGQELLGCCIMFAAIILAQLPEKTRSGRSSER